MCKTEQQQQQHRWMQPPQLHMYHLLHRLQFCLLRGHDLLHRRRCLGTALRLRRYHTLPHRHNYLFFACTGMLVGRTGITFCCGAQAPRSCAGTTFREVMNDFAQAPDSAADTQLTLHRHHVLLHGHHILLALTHVPSHGSICGVLGL